MDSNQKDGKSAPHFGGRRRVLQAGVAGALALGFPAIVRARSDAIKIGHLTPKTGFLGALGGWAELGIKLAAEEINAAGGVMGRQLDVTSEDSVNPATAATKAQRMLERDKVDVLMGEINSASAKTIMQVAARNRRLFMQIGARSDALRGANCNRYTFHVDIPVTVMVNAEGQGLLREGLIKGQRVYALTSDYLFGHDLAKAARKFVTKHGGTVIGDELVATSATDFSPYLLKIRQAKPDLIATNLGGNQVTNFVKQYAEFGLPYPVAGFNLNTADAWAAGAGNLGGIWPTVWHHHIDTPGTQGFRRRVPQEVRQDARKPRLDRVRLAARHGAGDERDQGDRQREADRLLREGAEVRPAQDAHGLFPQLGPPDAAGGLHLHGQETGHLQGGVGLPQVQRADSGSGPAAGASRPDQGRESLHVLAGPPDAGAPDAPASGA